MKNQSTARAILSDLVTSLSTKTDWVILGLTNPYEFRNAMEGRMSQAEWDCVFERKEKKKALARLRKKKWITNKTHGNQVEFRLNDDAVVSGIKNNIATSQQLHQAGHQTLVIFDIPEVASKSRRTFRNFLKESGFAQKQLSVWVSKKDVVKEMKILIRLLDAEKWVEVYTMIE